MKRKTRINPVKFQFENLQIKVENSLFLECDILTRKISVVARLGTELLGTVLYPKLFSARIHVPKAGFLLFCTQNCVPIAVFNAIPCTQSNLLKYANIVSKYGDIWANYI